MWGTSKQKLRLVHRQKPLQLLLMDWSCQFWLVVFSFVYPQISTQGIGNGERLIMKGQSNNFLVIQTPIQKVRNLHIPPYIYHAPLPSIGHWHGHDSSVKCASGALCQPATAWFVIGPPSQISNEWILTSFCTCLLLPYVRVYFILHHSQSNFTATFSKKWVLNNLTSLYEHPLVRW